MTEEEMKRTRALLQRAEDVWNQLEAGEIEGGYEALCMILMPSPRLEAMYMEDKQRRPLVGLDFQEGDKCKRDHLRTSENTRFAKKGFLYLACKDCRKLKYHERRDKPGAKERDRQRRRDSYQTLKQDEEKMERKRELQRKSDQKHRERRLARQRAADQRRKQERLAAVKGTRAPKRTRSTQPGRERS